MHKITIFHLYPDAMNLYGDLGNIFTLVKRCQWRDIKTEVVNIKRKDKADFSKADLIFMGGGQDRGQKTIAPDLLARKDTINEQIEKGVVALTVCGGFQLFGKYFKTADGEIIEGISIFDAYTIASSVRCIGNVVVDITSQAEKWAMENKYYEQNVKLTTLVGFENHSGLTYLEEGASPLGNIIIGFGNKGDRGFEGSVKKNAYGTYLHGSVLPKNPHLADHLILSALRHQYDDSLTLSPLDDTVERNAHYAAIERAKTAKTLHL